MIPVSSPLSHCWRLPLVQSSILIRKEHTDSWFWQGFDMLWKHLSFYLRLREIDNDLICCLWVEFWLYCLFFFIFVCVWPYVYMTIHVCMNICGGPRLMSRSSSIALHHIDWVRLSQSNPELSDMASLASQCALGILCLYLGGCDCSWLPHSPSIFLSLVDSELWSSQVSSQHFNH